MITDQVPHMDPRIVRIGISRMMATCRLLALTTDDYDGNAIEVLKDNMLNNAFAVARGNIALECSALMFLERLASTALQYQAILVEENDRVVQLHRENASLTQNWTAAHLQLGAMQSLHAISGIAFGHAKKWEDHAKIQTEAGSSLFRMTERSCPKSYIDLIDEDGLID